MEIVSDDFCKKKFIEEYNVFLNQLMNLFSQEDDKHIIQQFIDESDDVKYSRGKHFYNSLDDDSLFELFTKSKVKLFSSKNEDTEFVSTSLLGDKITLKKLINNQTQQTKDIIWKYLHLFYLLFENEDKNREGRTVILKNLLDDSKEKEDLSKKVKNDLLNVDVNTDTNNMIDDIVKSFEKSLNGQNSNPFESIMEITQNITDKYSQKIESGEIELDKLMGSIQDSIPGMPDVLGGMTGTKKEKEKVIIDENFSTDNVELGDKDKEKSSGMNLNNMLKMMNSMNSTSNGDNPDLGGLFSMLGKLDNISNDEEAEELKKEMDTYLNGIGVDVNKLNSQLDEAQDKLNNSENSSIISNESNSLESEESEDLD